MQSRGLICASVYVVMFVLDKKKHDSSTDGTANRHPVPLWMNVHGLLITLSSALHLSTTNSSIAESRRRASSALVYCFCEHPSCCRCLKQYRITECATTAYCLEWTENAGPENGGPTATSWLWNVISKQLW